MTPFEEVVLQSWQKRLQTEKVGQSVIDALVAVYQDTSISDSEQQEQLLLLLRTKPFGNEGES